MLIGNRDTFFPDMITDLITDLSDHPIWYETLKLGQAPTSQARPRDTDHLRPSNLAARILSLVKHTLSKFGGDPCPVRRGLAAAVKCYVQKNTFLSLLAVEQNERSQSRVWVSTQRGKLFCFLFSDPMIVGLRVRVMINQPTQEASIAYGWWTHQCRLYRYSTSLVVMCWDRGWTCISDTQIIIGFVASV